MSQGLGTFGVALSEWVGAFSWVVENVVWVILVVLALRLWTYLRTKRPAQNLWKIKEKDRVSFVITSSPVPDPAEYSDLVYPAEARGIGEIEAFLQQTFKGIEPRVALSNSTHAEHLRQHLIVIGGPVHNQVTREALEHMNTSLAHFEGNKLVMKAGEWTQEAVVDDEGGITRDVGLVIMSKNPWNPKKRLVVLAGSRTYGSLAAARAVVRSDVKSTQKAIKEVLKKSDTRVAFAVTSTVRDGDVFNVEVQRDSITSESS